MGEVVPIRSMDEAMAHAKDWMREAQEQEIRGDQYKLLYEVYKLRLRMAEAEIKRLRGMIE